MKNLTIRSKLVITIGAAVGAAAAVVLLLLSQLGATSQAYTDLLTGEVHQIDAARVVQVEFKKQVQEWKDLLLRGKNPADLAKHTEHFKTQDAAVRAQAEALSRVIADPATRERVATFVSSHQEMSVKYHRALQMFAESADKDSAAADKLVRGQDRAATNLIDGIVADLNQRIQTAIKVQWQNVAQRRRTVIGLALSTLALILGIAVFVSRDIVKAQEEIVRGLQAIAAGDLTTRLDDTRRDEMGRIVVALNAAIEAWRRQEQELGAATVAREREQAEGLRGGFQTILAAVETAQAGDLTQDIEVSGAAPIVGEVGSRLGAFIESLRCRISTIDGHAAQLATASEELSATAHELSAASNQTTSETAAAKATAGEMGSSVQTVSSSAAQMSDAMRDITVSAQQARKIASEAVTLVEDAHQTMARLGTSSSEIGEVVKVITSIAAQTNLLALNATIEAARAGEAGRGFAIVAREVKDLAAGTAKATEDIDQKIRAIQLDTKRAVDAISAVRSVIDNVNSFSTTVAAAVEEHTSITAEVRRTLTWVSEGTVKLHGNVSSVAEAAEATTGGARNTQGAADVIASMASELKQLVGQFRLVKHSAGTVAAPAARNLRSGAKPNGQSNGHRVS